MIEAPDERMLAAIRRLKGDSDFMIWVEALEQGLSESLGMMKSGEGPAMHRAQGRYQELENQLDLIHNPRKPDTPKKRGRVF